MSTERDRLIDRRDMLRRDIEELTQQIADGEVDEETGGRLATSYQGELDEVEAALKKLPKAAKKPATASKRPAKKAAPETRSMSRAVVGALILIAGLSAAIFFVARDTTPDTTVPPAAGAGDLSIDPATVTNEQLEEVVAANPNIPAMRLALADRYFRAEEFGAALDHYLFVAGNNPTPEDEAVALARIGWISHATGLPDAAEQYVLQSLELVPDNYEATLFIGFITLYGLDEPARALPQLEAALELPQLPRESASQIQQAIEEARQRIDS